MDIHHRFISSPQVKGLRCGKAMASCTRNRQKTLQSNIALENALFPGDFPIETSIFQWDFPMSCLITGDYRSCIHRRLHPHPCTNVMLAGAVGNGENHGNLRKVGIKTLETPNLFTFFNICICIYIYMYI